MTDHYYDGANKRMHLDLYPCFEGPRIAVIVETLAGGQWSERERIWVDADAANQVAEELDSLSDSARIMATGGDGAHAGADNPLFREPK